MKIRRKIIYYYRLIHSIPFNFKFLPFKQALKIPIIIHNVKIINMKQGTIRIESNEIKRGMIQLGVNITAKYPNNGVTIENKGKIIFMGNCTIGNNSFISTGKNGILIIGENLFVSSSINIICAEKIVIGKNNRFGWETTIMDTSFHPLFDRENHSFLPATRPITIGDNNWTGMQTIIMPGVNTPPHCIFGSRSIVTRSTNLKSYCLYGGHPIKLLRQNVERIIGQDNIDY